MTNTKELPKYPEISSPKKHNSYFSRWPLLGGCALLALFLVFLFPQAAYHAIQIIFSHIFFIIVGVVIAFAIYKTYAGHTDPVDNKDVDASVSASALSKGQHNNVPQNVSSGFNKDQEENNSPVYTASQKDSTV